MLKQSHIYGHRVVHGDYEKRPISRDFNTDFDVLFQDRLRVFLGQLHDRLVNEPNGPSTGSGEANFLPDRIIKLPGAVIDGNELDPGIKNDCQEEDISSPPGKEAKHDAGL